MIEDVINVLKKSIPFRVVLVKAGTLVTMTGTVHYIGIEYVGMWGTPPISVIAGQAETIIAQFGAVLYGIDNRGDGSYLLHVEVKS